MKKSFVSLIYGQIEYEESIWTGKKKITVNGVKLFAIGKNIYKLEHEGETLDVRLTGNFFKGANLVIEGEKYEISPKSLWYEYVLAIIPFAFIIVWGNSPQLCAILPVVGGAIGGAISGALGFFSMSTMKSTNNPLKKVLIGLGFFVASIAVCTLIGFSITGALNALIQ